VILTQLISAIHSLTIRPMKKIIILILACIPTGLFAQEYQDLFNVKYDQIISSNNDFKSVFLEENKVVFTLPNADLISNKDTYSDKSLLEPPKEEIHEDKEIMKMKNLFEDTHANFNDGVVSYSKDRKTVFFSVNRKIRNKKRKNKKEIKTKRVVNLQLFKANINESGEWVNLEMLPFNSNRYSTGQPSLNKDDTKLYFVSDGPESIGKTDIFVVDLHKDGTYGKPTNLGPKINSRDREIFPFIDKSNLLYFSSDIENKKGDLDVFVSKLFDNTVSTPLKIKGQLNIENEKHIGYFTSYKLVGKKVNDINANINSLPINIDCQQEVFGVVKNIGNQKLLPNVQIILFDDNNKKLSSFFSNKMDATFSFKQSCNENYKLKGYLEGYLIGELDIKTVNDLNAEPLEIIMNMSLDLSLATETNDIKAVQVKENSIEAIQVPISNNDTFLNSSYNFNSNNLVYTVQIGAFKGNAQTDKFFKLSSLYNHLYNDGFNRYFSGVFESRLEALNYMKLLKKDGYTDAYVVGLKGTQRF